MTASETFAGESNAALKAQFPLLAEYPSLHYLDNAATTQCHDTVITAVTEHETHARANVARGVYSLAEQATLAYENARRRMADFLQIKDPREIIFTAGTTASINLIALSFTPLVKPGDEILLSLAEHHSNFVPWQMLAKRTGARLRFLTLTDEGRIDLQDLDSMLTKRCRLVALTHASNVTGAVTDVAPIAAAARSVGAKILLDGAQMVPHGPLDLSALNVDFYAFSGHKMFGPTGIGVLWGRRSLLGKLVPVFGGGGMVRSVSRRGYERAPVPACFEPGTPPITQAVGLAAAAAWLMGLDQQALNQQLAALTADLLSNLQQVSGLRVIGPNDLKQRLGIVSIDIAGVHPHDLGQILGDQQIAVRAGHHCAQPLMNFFDLAGTTRISLAPYNNGQDIQALMAGLEHALRILR